MKKIMFISFSLFLFGIALAQETTIVERPDTYPYFQKEKCEGLSGEELSNCSNSNFVEFAKTIKYPAQAIEDKAEGKVYIKFIVYETGEVGKIEIAKSSGNQYLDRAAMSHLAKSSRLWTPATKDGKAVATDFVVPFIFAL